ncbi:DUF3575 domain-containing protein [Bacteroides xylanisolvens]|nr:DUF3575 domain-containing protein [Bacteroides xylanisolvens]
MKIQYIAILLLICWGSILKCSAQKVAVKTNLFYGAYSGTPNLGVEWGLSPRTTIELGAGLNWFTPNKASSNKKAGALGSVQWNIVIGHVKDLADILGEYT